MRMNEPRKVNALQGFNTSMYTPQTTCLEMELDYGATKHTLSQPFKSKPCIGLTQSIHFSSLWEGFICPWRPSADVWTPFGQF